MSCSDHNSGIERFPGTGCCGSSCAAGASGCLASAPRIRTCFCQENVGCLDRADCGGFRPRGTAATGACPGPCQCVEEEAWNANVPPKPNCEWLSNFCELRRQWSDHGRQNNCKCCNCKPCRTAAPCKPCLPVAPKSSADVLITNDCQNQDYYKNRLSGGACGQSSPQRSRSPSPEMNSHGSCQAPGSSGSSSYNCCLPGGNPCPVPFDDSSQSTMETPQSSGSCQPCSPSPRVTLNKRSCCQCIPGQCMCQPMPRNCNCPPPIQVDARADRQCDCECPSSPECACPPSERKFGRSKVKCPNARMCCPTPRPQPGPKCDCTKCQPCLPPPCDPCTSSKCRTVKPKVKACGGDPVCSDTAPCRPELPKPAPCRPIPPCNDCRKMSPSCRPNSNLANWGQDSRQMASRLQSRAPDCRYPVPSRSHKADEGYGDDNRGADTDCLEAQCHCGSSGSRGCDEPSDSLCSLNRSDCVTLDHSDTEVFSKGSKKRFRNRVEEERERYVVRFSSTDDKLIVKTSSTSLNTRKEEKRKNDSKIYQSDRSNEPCSSRNFRTNCQDEFRQSTSKTKIQQRDATTSSCLETSNVINCDSQCPKATVPSAVAKSPKSPGKLFRSLIRAKSRL